MNMLLSVVSPPRIRADTTAAGESMDAGGVMSIDLRAIRPNYRTLMSELGSTPLGGVVKADAYGSAQPVSPLFYMTRGVGTSSWQRSGKEKS
ncbi:hypothetical protein [Rhizobium sp. SAFR-030]|uniref:hypothetical protein n=1 Tax=Rhizobium sp. SAFR-030 TaxID=3387277 RepID=UPI003F815018